MSLPVPNLDDRTWKQLVDESVRLIPRYAPEWTNHNPSDPGVTLLELYAWMTEMTLYRLNKVPEKNFLTFLDLIGVRLLPPEPARAVLRFEPAEGMDLLLPKGTQVATLQAGGGDPVTFETQRDLPLLPHKIVRVVSSHRGSVADHTEALVDDDAREALFAGVTEVERFLYVGDDRLLALNEECAVDLLFERMPGSSGPQVPQIVEWQYWDGKRWREMAPNRAESRGPGHVAFGSHPGAEPTEVNGVETVWVRGRLTEPLADPRSVQLDDVLMRVEILGEGIPADHGFINIGNYIFLPVEQGKSFHPFGEEPQYDYAFYLSHDEIFKAPDCRVRVEVTLADQMVQQPPEPSPDLVVLWEYWNGRRWSELGRTGAMGVSGEQGNHRFLDSTKAFSASGAVSFDRPHDMQQTEVGGQRSYWLRARINAGNFGAPGSYELVGTNWEFKEDRPLRPPLVKDLVLKYVREPRPVSRVLTYNDFTFRDHTDDARTPYVYFQPFLPDQDENPAVYLGFTDPFPRRQVGVYFKLDEDAEEGGADKDYSGKGPRVVWETWDGARWVDLLPQDGTRGFTRSGYLDFEGPREMAPRVIFDTEAYWMRARLETGAWDSPPVLRAVLLNAVDAINGETVEELVGSGDGNALQTMQLANAPILAGTKLWVREPAPPSGDDLKRLVAEEGDDAVYEDEDGDGHWVRWHAVDHFYQSQPGDRHYVLDPINGELSFGDGRNGLPPPAGRDNVRALYRVGGGQAGNVGPHSLTVLKQAVAFVQSVDNPFPAHGGTDPETVEDAKKRGTFAIKNRDRAITAEDYEQLALAASRRVARARCVQSPVDGSVVLLIVPKADRADDAHIVPSRDLLDQVSAYIEARRLITARVQVGKPRYVDASLRLTVTLKPGATADRVKSDVRDKVRRLLHPLKGGPKKDGWPFGRSVGKADLYPLVEGVDGIDRVQELVIVDEGRRLAVETLKLGEDELPHVVEIDVVDRG